MDSFLYDLGILLDWVQYEGDINDFEESFKKLVHDHREDETVMDISRIVAHNYNCHKYGRDDAIIKNLKQWKSYSAKVH